MSDPLTTMAVVSTIVLTAWAFFYALAKVRDHIIDEYDDIDWEQ